MTRHVSLLAMGGTISKAADAEGEPPRLGADQLGDSLGAVHAGVVLRTRDITRLSSRAITPADMWQLAAAVEDEIAGGADGIVISHGTDTVEETAYALALLVDAPAPVVLTGAMRPPHVPGADGPANLLAAVTAATYPSLAGYGPVVVFHDEIHTARWVTKQHSARLAAFASPAAGPIGYVAENDVHLLLGPPPGSDRLPVTAPPTKRVELIWTAAGTDGLLVDAIAGHADGVVVAGTGGGHVPPALAETLVRVAATLPVVLASRCVDGHVLRNSYGGVGSERHLLAHGVLSAGSLSPLKARLRLLFGLSAGLSAADLMPSGHR